MKKLHKFNENWMDDPSSIDYRRNFKLNKDDRTDILGKGHRAFDDSDEIEQNKLPSNGGFDLDLKSKDLEELDDTMTLLVANFGIGKVRNWIENYLR